MEADIIILHSPHDLLLKVQVRRYCAKRCNIMWVLRLFYSLPDFIILLHFLYNVIAHCMYCVIWHNIEWIIIYLSWTISNVGLLHPQSINVKKKTPTVFTTKVQVIKVHEELLPLQYSNSLLVRGDHCVGDWQFIIILYI